MFHLKRIFLVYCTILLIVSSVVIQSCSKTDVASPVVNNYITPDTLINGTIKFRDSAHSINQNGLILQYISSSPCYPSNEIFFFTAIPNGIDTTGVTYSWYIQDGQDHYILTGKKIQYLYNTAGGSNYVKVEAYKNGNIIDSVSTSVTAYGQRANNRDVGFQMNYATTTNKRYVAFNSTAQNPLDGYINALYWDFGDGSSDGSNNKYPNHTFPYIPADINYKVTLYVNNNANCKDSVAHTILVPASYSLPCKFNYSSKNACTTGEIFTFNADTTGVPKGADYIWDFHDFSTGIKGNPITHQYATPNRYQISLLIKYHGVEVCNYTDTNLYAVGQNIKPSAYFYGDPKTADSSYWFFNDLTTFNNGGFLDDILWDLGDGNTRHPSKYSPSLDYQYAILPTRKTYTVKMLVTAISGCKDSSYFKVTVPGK